ncbi:MULTISPECIES: ABC transporter ATP-binding protein [Brevibacillus]|uniref:Nitrate/sulfonate/bicarbonate ABC transporter ATP-binding protein n=1 Tax=Brevibacillus parabrevis TaxID=54914 RepID=A0A4Y3PW59_BREPA|nr:MULTISPECIES: ATP-binding cassette domain-containing protein [Brevibacillus]RNB97627.1 ATP-binding cassette domain-containing protein [Brevibacillus parabrevis]UED69495.1 ATP-binding cassette domain-containing protein [Brevibacillus sp. HD3.3A]GEB34791.1 nitrate/sulfonate/bicarbonate ABC transporter ATP-binding protein [Brevibacillus parabrevis]
MRFTGISLKYGAGRLLFDNFSLEAAKGQVTCLMGTSGIGKTTLLKMAAGLIRPAQGVISRDEGERLGYVFQEPRLLPEKTVLENVLWVLEQRQEQEQERVLAMLDAADLSAVLHAYPDQLSGGMRQRVSVVRAFAARPGLLFMDEPFQSLDAATRAGMHQLFRKLWESEQPTVLLVTHDLDEALALGTRIVVLGCRPMNILADVTAASVEQHGGTYFSQADQRRLWQLTTGKDGRETDDRKTAAFKLAPSGSSEI